MDSLVDLICFWLRQRLAGKCGNLLIQMRHLPVDLLERIGDTPTYRPHLKWGTISPMEDDCTVTIESKQPDLPLRFTDNRIPLPVRLQFPLTIYVGKWADFDGDYTYAVSLHPFHGCQQKQITSLSDKVYI